MNARIFVAATAFVATVTLAAWSRLPDVLPRAATAEPATGASRPIEAEPAAASVIDAPVHTPTEPQLTDAEIEELDTIRRQLGLSPLQNSEWLDDSTKRRDVTGNESLFADQLRAQFGRPRPAGVEAEPRRDRAEDQHVSASAAADFRRQSVRSLSRRLDAISHDLEDLQFYDEADTIRELSHRLRLQVRP